MARHTTAAAMSPRGGELELEVVHRRAEGRAERASPRGAYRVFPLIKPLSLCTWYQEIKLNDRSAISARIRRVHEIRLPSGMSAASLPADLELVNVVGNAWTLLIQMERRTSSAL